MDQTRTFISYSKADGDFAVRLANDLRSAGVSIWIDQLDIAPGLRWDREIEAAMSAAGRIIVILSPTSTSSENVQDEIGFAFDSRKSIIPILCKPCDVPMRLRRLQFIDFTRDYDEAFKRLLVAARLPVPARAEGEGASAAAMPASVAVPKSAGRALSARNLGIGLVALAGLFFVGRTIFFGDSERLAVEVAPVSAAEVSAAEFSCDLGATYRSVDGDVQTLTIRNELDVPVSLFWINQGGELEEHGEIAPKGKEDISTYGGHFWMLKDAAGNCLKVAGAPGTVTLR